MFSNRTQQPVQLSRLSQTISGYLELFTSDRVPSYVTPNEMGFTNGFSHTPASAAAWQAVVATNMLGYLDHRTAILISRAYAAQRDERDQIHAFNADFPVIIGGFAGNGKAATVIITLEIHLGEFLSVTSWPESVRWRSVQAPQNDSLII